MYNRNEIHILLTNWGVWARGNTCPKYHSTLARYNSLDSYDAELGLKVEQALIKLSVQNDITPVVYFYVNRMTAGSICQKMGCSLEKYTKLMENLEDELSLVL